MQAITKVYRIITRDNGYQYTSSVKGRKNVDTMSDAEIRNKLCKVEGGCRACEVMDACRYGQEAIRRELI